MTLDVDKMLHGRARNTRVKQIVIEECGDKIISHKVRDLAVSNGKGTARGWVTVLTRNPIPSEKQERITERLLAEYLISTYPDDMSDRMWPCVSFRKLSP